MTTAERLVDLRELMLSAPESGVTRALAIILALTLMGIVLWLVRGRRLREELTPIWMVACAALVVVSVSSDLLRWLTRVIGAWTPSSTVFFLGEIFLTALSLHYAVRLSRTSVQVKNLAQEVALLKTQLASTGAIAGPQPRESTPPAH
jgi:hypothetical protein